MSGSKCGIYFFVHKNSGHPATPVQWNKFFEAANESDMFHGGSEISPGVKLGASDIVCATESVVGYMRFETDDVNKLYRFLELHPVKIQGGTLELCETPKS